jgi:Spy/CpxP family protein refolding chaperone
MKKLVTVFAGVVLSAALTTAAFAQAAGPTGGGVQTGGTQGLRGGQQGQKGKARAPIGQKVLKELNLTPDQMKQVKDLVKKFEEKRQQEQGAVGGKPNRKEAAGLRKQFMEDLMNILTPEQREKFKQIIAQRGKGKLGGAPGTLGGAGTTGTGTGTTGGGVKTGGGGL